MLLDSKFQTESIAQSIQSALQAKLCSGFGQFHSPWNTKNPREYVTVTLGDIEAMIMKPPSVAKEKGQWFIPSTRLTRNYAEQRALGQFWALWADIDDPGGMTFKEIFSRSGGAIPGKLMGYTSRSAKPEKQKSRLILPLAVSVSGVEYSVLAKIFNDKLEALGIIPDRKTELPGQIAYLPNRGEFYDYQIRCTSDRSLFHPSTWAAEMDAERVKLEEEAQRQAQARMEAQRKAAERMRTGAKSPMDAYNSAYDLEMVLTQYGYIRRGEKWLSPNSETGSPGVSIRGAKWFSSHGSDSEIGMDSKGGRMGDAFDLFVHYEHQGDRNAALHAAGNMFTTLDGVTIEKENQRQFMEQQEKKNVADMFDFNGPPKQESNSGPKPGQSAKPVFDLLKFVLNGASTDMESKMLNDVFVMGRLAILGQATTFYAKPNAGKTLMTIYLIIERIDAGDIQGHDVFYVNADDNYKGLVYKLKIAERYGFNMLAPGHNEFKAEDLPKYLAGLVGSGNASGKILVLDTVKKFTDLMNKTKVSDFANAVRQFVSHGGTVIMLAHVNKHRDDEGKVVFAGTQDLVDDVDCAYNLDIVNEDANEIRTIRFENIKSRGDVARDATYSYDAKSGTTYQERLDSIQEVGPEAMKRLEEKKRLADMLQKNQEAIDVIIECIRDGVTGQNDLVKEAQTRSGVSRRKLLSVLKEHTGADTTQNQFWHTEKGEKNRFSFRLNYGV